MTYQVLARKWRPRTFEQLAGQRHISRPLIHSLENERLHHAYLFTGTRGIGKTTIARIFAKCLNCEKGVTASPCGQCEACRKIDEGCFLDLMEIDAASRTKVEDTRELLENVPYPPTSGRFKIYLIDEVHMLSGHSFNALLKTLEEPPSHVKFLLATTDPQKLPITVLSRCLQFHLKPLSIENITDYLKNILQSENIPFEQTALLEIAESAKGSMRDALSLLEQAIAYSHGCVETAIIENMLGVPPEKSFSALLEALAQKDGAQLLKISRQLGEEGIDFQFVLKELIKLFHAMALFQVVPDLKEEKDVISKTASAFCDRFSKEDIQLFYQIALLGYKDLSLFETANIGFEMTLLRMLAFQPEEVSETIYKKASSIKSERQTESAPISEEFVNKSADPARGSDPAIKSQDDELILQIPDWGSLLEKLNLSGMLKILASNCILKEARNGVIELGLQIKHKTMLNEKLRLRFNEVLNSYFQQKIKLLIHVDDFRQETPVEKIEKQMTEKHRAAVKTIGEDPNIQAMMEELGAAVDPSLVTSAE